MIKNSLQKLVQDWQLAGIQEGDTVLIHSSLKRTLKRVGDISNPIEAIIKTFQNAVGPNGTLLFPLFNFSFTEGIPFDIRTTPSKMGALTEAARKMPGAMRTGHPIYSFAVLGAKAAEFENIQNFSGYGKDSPFARLRELDGKIAILDLADQNSMTFYHHVEEMFEVPYRFHKVFKGEYTNLNGITSVREFGLFVRNIEMGVLTDVNRMGEKLWQMNLYSGNRPETDGGLRVISSRKLYDAVADVIQSGKAINYLYSIRK
jgi:aminoglycoside 3-N-acetyltransferase